MRKSLAIVSCAWILALAGCAEVTGEQLSETFNQGLAAYDAGDYPAAYKIWSSIEDYDLGAMRNVAMMLRDGQGVAKDPKKAEDLYETAAEAGMPTAQADLAEMYLKGELGTPDPKRALPLLVAAAAANHPVAQFDLGQMYETGEDGLLPKDTDKARKLYALAASHGMADAQKRLDALGPEPPHPPPPGPTALSASNP